MTDPEKIKAALETLKNVENYLRASLPKDDQGIPEINRDFPVIRALLESQTSAGDEIDTPDSYAHSPTLQNAYKRGYVAASQQKRGEGPSVSAVAFAKERLMETVQRPGDADYEEVIYDGFWDDIRTVCAPTPPVSGEVKGE